MNEINFCKPCCFRSSFNWRAYCLVCNLWESCILNLNECTWLTWITRNFVFVHWWPLIIKSRQGAAVLGFFRERLATKTKTKISVKDLKMYVLPRYSNWCTIGWYKFGNQRQRAGRETKHKCDKWRGNYSV